MGRSDQKSFLDLVKQEFPDAVLDDEYSEGLLHCEMAEFRLYLEGKIENGNFWVAEKGFKAIEELLISAEPDLKNAIEISFLYDFAIGDQTEKQIAFVKERVSKKIRKILSAHSSVWP